MTISCCDISIPDGSSALHLGPDAVSGKQTLTCTNLLGRSFQGKAELVLLGEADKAAGLLSWLTVTPERAEFAKGASMVFTVSADPPKDTLSGAALKLAYRLRISNNEAANEESSESRDLTLELTPPAASRAGTPKWLFAAIAAGVLILGALVFAVVRLIPGTKVGTACGPEFSCPATLTCDKTRNVCLGDLGFKGCRKAADCLVDSCVDGACAYPRPGARCKDLTASKDCPGNQGCVAILNGPLACLLKPREACSSDLDCTSFFCNDGKCNRDDGKCDTAQECGTGFDCKNARCGLPDGSDCDSSQATSSGLCLSGKCLRNKCVASGCGSACGPGTHCDDATNQCLGNPNVALPRVSFERADQIKIQLFNQSMRSVATAVNRP